MEIPKSQRLKRCRNEKLSKVDLKPQDGYHISKGKVCFSYNSNENELINQKY